MGSPGHQQSPSFRDFYGTLGSVLHVWSPATPKDPLPIRHLLLAAESYTAPLDQVAQMVDPQENLHLNLRPNIPPPDQHFSTSHVFVTVGIIQNDGFHDRASLITNPNFVHTLHDDIFCLSLFCSCY